MRFVRRISPHIRIHEGPTNALLVGCVQMDDAIAGFAALVNIARYDLKEPQDGEGTPGATALALAAHALTFIARSAGAPGFSVEHETVSEYEDEDELEDEDEVEEAALLVDGRLWPGAEAAGWSVTRHNGRKYVYTCPEGKAFSSRLAALNSLEEEESQEEGQEESGQQRRRVVWSPELHSKFEAAVSALREDAVRPQTVHRLMDVEGLTLASVTSHLRTYRNRRENDRAVRRPVPKAKPAAVKPQRKKARAERSTASEWREGDAVEAMDLRQVWCPATVQAVEGDELMVQHYEAWN